MNEERLIIIDAISSNLAVSSEKAKTVYSQIESNIHRNIKTILDFSNIKSLTTAFLNIAIGELYRDKSREVLNKYIEIDGSTLTPLQKDKVKMVMDNSREKYSEELKRKIEGVALDGKAD